MREKCRIVLIEHVLKGMLVWGTSLEVQWLRLQASNVGSLGVIPGQQTAPTCHAVEKKSCLLLLSQLLDEKHLRGKVINSNLEA